MCNCSPFYGQRRPVLQRGAKLLCVSDLLLLGRATIEEARSLLHWLDSEAGFGKMGVCGLSMGKTRLEPILIANTIFMFCPIYLSVMLMYCLNRYCLFHEWLI
jgi:hypothetical protein